MKRQLLLIGILLLLAGSALLLSSTLAHTTHPTTKSVAVIPPTSLVATAQLATAPSTTPLLSTSTQIKKTAPQASTTTRSTTLSQSAVSTTNSVQEARTMTTAGTHLLSSLVNIVCLSSDPTIPSISGTGVIIDSRGIVLTASHVAQFFLLQKYLGPSKVQCLLRTGSPARRAYTADPIYVSKSWLDANPTTLTTTSPKGTGQYDIALLAITGTATSTPLPHSFPATPLSTQDPANGESIAIGSYGAQYLSSSELNYSLYPILLFGTIQDRYTYSSGSVDVVTINGSAAAQEGSSGGGIVDSSGALIGTITTSATSGTITNRLLNAVTPRHLRNSYRLDTGNDLTTVLSTESIQQMVDGFNAQAEALGAQLSADVAAAKH